MQHDEARYALLYNEFEMYDRESLIENLLNDETYDSDDDFDRDYEAHFDMTLHDLIELNIEATIAKENDE